MKEHPDTYFTLHDMGIISRSNNNFDVVERLANSAPAVEQDTLEKMFK